MQYKVFIKSYDEKTVKESAGDSWRPLKMLEDLLNGELDKKEHEGFKLKEIIPTSMHDKLVYTVILEKE